MTLQGTRGCGAALLACWLTVSGGCPQSSDDNGGSGEPNTPTTIRVRIVNQSGVTLDPEFYASGAAVGLDELFQPGNKFTRFGVGTLGILGRLSSDEFVIDCSAARVIGTRGGRFGDDLNDPIGTGRQIVLTQELNVFCGGRLTLTYSRSGDTFTTTFDVQP